MDIYVRRFDGGIMFLEPYLEDRRFSYDDWNTLEPLVADYKADLWTRDSRNPGWHDQFKLAFRYILNQRDLDLEAHFDRILDFGLPEPIHDFLVYLWSLLYPGEHWQETADLSAVRVHW